MKHIYGLRTLIAGLFGMLMLLVGLWLLERNHRHEAYFAFSTGIGCIIGALAVKSVGSSAVAGDGLKKGLQNLATPAKPGDGT